VTTPGERKSVPTYARYCGDRRRKGSEALRSPTKIAARFFVRCFFDSLGRFPIRSTSGRARRLGVCEARAPAVRRGGGDCCRRPTNRNRRPLAAFSPSRLGAAVSFVLFHSASVSALMATISGSVRRLVRLRSVEAPRPAPPDPGQMLPIRPSWTAERTSLGCLFLAIVRQVLFTRSARCSSALEGAGSGKEACAWALSAGSFWG
jgi:hypothetical protein